MIFVDSSVWVDFFRDRSTPQVEWLDRNLGLEPLHVGDLVLAEVLQGFREDRGFEEARRLLGRLGQIDIAGQDIAIEVARNYRKLRGLGVTVRGIVDLLIATRCVSSGFGLLHADGDFDAFERHLGLRSVDCTGST